ncbi:type VI secretion system baseplate subunit TssF [Roseobacter weihaiensis]|uniref:type VI secretion system baseplate subunit TssF n=1 Tax=Roseobacter weihaiensis TaxID=2763262 RepID=UPI001D0AB554|nr:type VI secretion system baseplate subunit TssF [Roseobacter sp. H9]
MSGRFHDFYNAELTALRRRAGRFAASYPKLAGRLRLAPDTADDPHVERLIQSFAYTAARVRQKLDDSLPELTDSLLETLYPHYLAPTPAMTVLAFTPDAGLDVATTVPRGTEVASETIDNDRVRFATTQDVPLAPLRIEGLRMMARPFDAPPGPKAARACLRISLRTTNGASLQDIDLKTLRLYLSGPGQEAPALARLLLQHHLGSALAQHADDPDPLEIAPTALWPIGFDPDTALLPYPKGTFRGYRMLTEFAVLPEKFLYFDLALPPLPTRPAAELFLYFDAPADETLRGIGVEALTLHATPAINLFPTRTEPVPFDGTRTAYPLQADARRPRTRLVHSVRRVTLTHADGTDEVCPPFFHRLTDHRSDGVFWQLQRTSEAEGHAPGATSIAFVDHRNRATVRRDSTASVEVLATNGTLAGRLPFGGGQPRLSLVSALDAVAGIACLRAPTTHRGPAADADRAWSLISHLSLNHLSLDAAGAPALRDILRLYDPGDGPEMAQMIDAIDVLETNSGLGRVDGVTVTGTDVLLTFDDSRISAAQAVFFGAVIDRFLGCYTTINTFTRLTLRMKNRTDTLARFEARAGEEALI